MFFCFGAGSSGEARGHLRDESAGDGAKHVCNSVFDCTGAVQTQGSPKLCLSVRFSMMCRVGGLIGHIRAWAQPAFGQVRLGHRLATGYLRTISCNMRNRMLTGVTCLGTDTSSRGSSNARRAVGRRSAPAAQPSQCYGGYCHLQLNRTGSVAQNQISQDISAIALSRQYILA